MFKKFLVSAALALTVPLTAACADHNVWSAKFPFGEMILTERPCEVPNIVKHLPKEIVDMLKQGKVKFTPELAKQLETPSRELCFIVMDGAVLFVDEVGQEGIVPAEAFKDLGKLVKG